MEDLKIDLDLLLESFTLDKEGMCEEYLDTTTGEVINIPYEVAKVFKNEEDGENLPEWQKLLLEDAEAVYMDSEDKYIKIPTLESSHIYNLMSDFAEERVSDSNLREKLSDALAVKNPMSKFKNELYSYPELLEQWYDYEEEKIKEYIVQWLNCRGINAGE